MNKFGLPEGTIKEITDYFSSNSNIEKVKIYGSRAKSTYRQGSDIDFAVWVTDKNKISAIKADLEDLPTPYKFDVTDYNSITNVNLKNSIDTEGIIFYTKI